MEKPLTLLKQCSERIQSEKENKVDFASKFVRDGCLRVSGYAN